jgi:hypothetical protein
MDRFVSHYLESIERELSASNALAYVAGDLSAYRLTPFDTTCVQGSFRYAARAFAQRGGRVFFLAYDTQQYGVGRWDESGEGCVKDADQYLTPDAAIKRFLSDEKPAD